MTPLVYIIILNWNNTQDTMQCLRSVGKLDYSNFRVIIADNGSQEDPRSILNSAQTSFDLIISPVNYGYTGGNNIAIRYALQKKADYVWLLNNDTTFEPNTLSLLIDAMQEDSRLGMTSPVIRYHPSNDIEHAGEIIDIETATFTGFSKLEQARKWQETNPERVVLFGTALLIRSELITKIGFFDEDFFAYWEDYDMSIRSNLAGYRNAVVFDTCIYHVKPSHLNPQHEEARKPYFYYYMTRNEFILWRKHAKLHMQLKTAIWATLRVLKKTYRLKKHIKLSEACILGLWHGLSGRAGAYDPAWRIREPLRTIAHYSCVSIGRLIQ